MRVNLYKFIIYWQVTTFNDEPLRASRPYDKRRDGFVMGEGCVTIRVYTIRVIRINRRLRDGRGVRDSPDIKSDLVYSSRSWRTMHVNDLCLGFSPHIKSGVLAHDSPHIKSGVLAHDGC